MSDNDLIKLQSFEQLERLDFCAGSGVGDAKIIDEGLKILSELNLTKLSSLIFYKSDNITDNSVEILKRIPNLREVMLAGCKNISESARAELSKKVNVYYINSRNL